jgi:hypothetical protein
MTLYDEATCYRCGANAWTSCNHREATRVKPAFVDKMDRQEIAKKRAGGGRYTFTTSNDGLNFKTRKRL